MKDTGKQLTVAAINRIKPAKTGRAVHWDSLIRGLGVLITNKGAMTWLLQDRCDGKTIKLSFGRPGAETIEGANIYSLADARKRAGELKAMMAAKIDPRTTRGWRGLRQPKPEEIEASKHASGTVGALIDEWHEKYLKPNTRRPYNHYRNARTYLAPWLDRQFAAITDADLLDITDALMAERKPGAANNAHELATRVFNWAKSRRKIETMPFAGLKRPAKEKPRGPGRRLAPDEIKELWTADLGVVAGSFTKMLLLTAQRRECVAGLRWSELDFATNTWTIPGHRMKNGEQHTVPLPDLAIEILNQMPRYADGDCIFTTTEGAKPISGFSKIKARIDRTVELPRWTFHDLRRTVSSEMAQMKIPLQVTEKLLDHRTGEVSGVAAIYNLHAYEAEVRSAVDAWSNRLNEILNGEERENVVRLSS